MVFIEFLIILNKIYSPLNLASKRFCPPQMLQVGKPGLGGTGLANGAKVGKSVPGGGLGAADDVGFVDG